MHRPSIYCRDYSARPLRAEDAGPMTPPDDDIHMNGLRGILPSPANFWRSRPSRGACFTRAIHGRAALATEIVRSGCWLTPCGATEPRAGLTSYDRWAWHPSTPAWRSRGVGDAATAHISLSADRSSRRLVLVYVGFSNPPAVVGASSPTPAAFNPVAH